jgi:P-type E1-E2 ATPase
VTPGIGKTRGTPTTAVCKHPTSGNRITQFGISANRITFPIGQNRRSRTSSGAGDLISIKLGAIIPADVKLLDGAYLSVDRSALTGESLPVDKKSGDEAYSASVVTLGEMTAAGQQHR